MTTLTEPTFQVWQAEYDAGALGRVLKDGHCEGCGATDRELSEKGGHCPQCLRQLYGYARAEREVGYGMVVGAIRQVLGLGVDRATVLAAIDEALDPTSDYGVPHDWRYTA